MEEQNCAEGSDDEKAYGAEEYEEETFALRKDKMNKLRRTPPVHFGNDKG